MGVDLEAFVPAQPEARRLAKRRLGVGAGSVALYLGRFGLRDKCLEVLLASWRSAAPAGWRLVLAGEGPDKIRVGQLAEDLDPPVVFVDWQDDVRWLLTGSDLLVLPTHFEGTNGAMAQALAFGLPVLLRESRATTGSALMALS